MLTRGGLLQRSGIRSSKLGQRIRFDAIDLTRVAVIGLALTWLAPFGLGDVTSQASRDVFYRAWSVAYPVERSPKVGVVLLGETDLHGSPWPAPYSMHQHALESLMRYEPAAVVVDLLFVDERKDETIQGLIEIAQSYHEAGIPLYFATAPAGGGVRAIRADLAALHAMGVLKLVDVSLGSTSGRLPSYRLEGEVPDVLPAARAVFEGRCATSSGEACGELPQDDEFEVWWAAPPHTSNCKESAEQLAACAQISENQYVRFVRLLIQDLLPFVGSFGFQETDPVQSNYHPVVSYTELRSGAVAPAKKEALQGAVIFYGADLAIGHDRKFNPVYDIDGERRVPGVFYHAMAYDNLVALNGDIIKSPSSAWGSSPLHTAVILLGCCLAAFVARTALLRPGQSAARLDLCVWLLFSVLVAWIEFALLRTSPGNWIGAVLSAQIGSARVFNIFPET